MKEKGEMMIPKPVPDVPYVMVSQNDQGIVGNYELWSVPANLLVLSAGGYGHVPIPLIEPLRTAAARRRRRHQVSYTGS